MAITLKGILKSFPRGEAVRVNLKVLSRHRFASPTANNFIYLIKLLLCKKTARATGLPSTTYRNGIISITLFLKKNFYLLSSKT